MQYKKKGYGFNIVTERIAKSNDKESDQTKGPLRYGTIPYTDDAVILQAILYYSKVKGTKKCFTRKEITDDHLFKYTKLGKQQSLHHTVFNNMFEGDKKKLKMIQRKPIFKKQ